MAIEHFDVQMHAHVGYGALMRKTLRSCSALIHRHPVHGSPVHRNPHRNRFVRVLAISGLVAAECVIVACGGAPKSTGAADPSGVSETSTPKSTPDETMTGPPVPWADMDESARAAYMAEVVVPRTRPLFVGFDAERYGNFGCATCHGSRMKERHFEMPNPDILALHPTGTPEQKQMVEDHPKMVRLMFNHVLPTVRDSLGLPTYNADTQEGFSCFSCHPAAAAE